MERIRDFHDYALYKFTFTFTTSVQKTERVYSYNPRDHTRGNPHNELYRTMHVDNKTVAMAEAPAGLVGGRPRDEPTNSARYDLGKTTQFRYRQFFALSRQ